jgi:hypothetical protein
MHVGPLLVLSTGLSPGSESSAVRGVILDGRHGGESPDADVSQPTGARSLRASQCRTTCEATH